MSEMVASFDSRCRKMPKKLREWEAFQVNFPKMMGTRTHSLK